ncbi:hypothetical protein [Haliangium sp.]|uniref:hypothetical protein n=1 Tax=Haliangium sp. TaxID=2663208 RepID=UPI003D11656F
MVVAASEEPAPAPIAVIPLYQADDDGDAALAAAAAWFDDLSGGRWRPCFRRLVAVVPPRPAACYAHRGGMGRWPANSQQLAWDALAAVQERDALGERVIFLAPDGFAPHAWRLRRGGFPLGRRRWVRRYAVLPPGVSAGTAAHELGHLCLGWPDLDRTVGDDCLMGSTRLRSRLPVPCAPLRVHAGWADPVAVGRETRVGDLADLDDSTVSGAEPGALAAAHLAGSATGAATVAGWRWCERSVLVERRGRRLLVFEHDATGVSAPAAPSRALAAAPAVHLLARIALAPDDLQRPLLALLAPIVRRPWSTSSMRTSSMRTSSARPSHPRVLGQQALALGHPGGVAD